MFIVTKIRMLYQQASLRLTGARAWISAQGHHAGTRRLAPRRATASTSSIRPAEERQRRINELVQQAQGMRAGTKGNTNPVLISDAISEGQDGSMIQWVQLVMAGGGMLGIAHVGFVRMLEEAGVRFLGLGGTSAGAINAALIAAVRDGPADKSWDKTLKILEECDFSTFEDGDRYFKQLREKVQSNGVSFSFGSVVKNLVSAFLHKGKIESAWQKLGLHKGVVFRKWMAKQLDQYNASTLALLQSKMKLNTDRMRVYQRPEGGTTDSQSCFNGHKEQLQDITDTMQRILDAEYPLKLVASEIGTQSMVVFPKDADLFYSQAPGDADPADFVRASMSIPLFFEPFKLPYTENGVTYGNLKDANSVSPTWEERTGYAGVVPSTTMFCDGGTLSNFPIGLFHRAGKPLMPTLGIQLGADRNSVQPINNPIELLASMNNTSRHLMDREFLVHNKDYRNLVGTVDTTGFGWLNFAMTNHDMEELLLRGMEAGAAFLEGWRQQLPDGKENKWEAYKRLRVAMATNDNAVPSVAVVANGTGNAAPSAAEPTPYLRPASPAM